MGPLSRRNLKLEDVICAGAGVERKSWARDGLAWGGMLLAFHVLKR
jgi:hypothetical protein